jgi:hypothetical protein
MSGPRRAGVMRGWWSHYRNARLWGRSVRWSVGYAQEAHRVTAPAVATLTARAFRAGARIAPVVRVVRATTF